MRDAERHTAYLHITQEGIRLLHFCEAILISKSANIAKEYLFLARSFAVKLEIGAADILAECKS